MTDHTAWKLALEVERLSKALSDSELMHKSALALVEKEQQARFVAENDATMLRLVAKSLPTEKHGWISVADRLPADGEDVLYAFNGSTFRGRYLGSNNENSLPTFGGEAGWLTGDVEFWQPTPKAPESTHLGKTSWS